MWWIIAFALFWPLIGELTANLIVWIRVGKDDFIFPTMDVLRRLIPAGIVSGFFLGWLVFYLLDRVRNTAVRILTVLACMFSATISDRATLMAGFVAVWWYFPFRISYFVNEVLTMILMTCCGSPPGPFSF
jgi:NhaP-type Na+/H+ or K+/H+ antiporter